MTAKQSNAALEALGIESHMAAAAILGIGCRSVIRCVYGRQNVPESVHRPAWAANDYVIMSAHPSVAAVTSRRVRKRWRLGCVATWASYRSRSLCPRGDRSTSRSRLKWSHRAEIATTMGDYVHHSVWS
jgi:hypothetical protein